MSVPDNSQRRMGHMASPGIPRLNIGRRITTLAAILSITAFGGSRLYGQNLNKELAALGSKVGETTIVSDKKAELGFPPYFNKDGSIPSEFTDPINRKWGAELQGGNTILVKYFPGFTDSDGKTSKTVTLTNSVSNLVVPFHTSGGYINDVALDIASITIQNGVATLYVSMFDTKSEKETSVEIKNFGNVIGKVYWMGKVYVLSDIGKLALIDATNKTGKPKDLSKMLTEQNINISNGVSFSVVNDNGYFIRIKQGNNFLQFPVEVPLNEPVSQR